MELEINGVTFFPGHCMGTVQPKRADVWKWRLWWRFFGYKRPAPYENMYLITEPFHGKKMAMVSFATFERLKREAIGGS